MRDGTILRADVYRPESPGEYPVLLQRNPYDKTQGQGIVFQHPVWYARHGYIVVVQDSRGRFASEGLFEPYHREAEDGADTVSWVAGLPGSSGVVGMFGFSYSGAQQLLAASEQPPALRCLAPGFTGSDFYDDWTYVGGALSHAFLISWVVTTLALPDALRSGVRAAAEALLHAANNVPALYTTQPLHEFPLLKEHALAPYFFDWLEHDTRDEYWREISISERHDRIVAPCLHYGGWYDSFIEGTLTNYSVLANQAEHEPSSVQRLVVGPWAHMPWSRNCGDCGFGSDADNHIDELQLAWFDHFLRGRGDVRETPPVRLFVMGENRWRDADGWPPPNARTETWFLRSSGRALSVSGDGVLTHEGPGDEPPDVYVSAPGMPVPSMGGRSCCITDISPIGPREQATVEIRNDVLVYSTATLEHDLEVTGTVWLVLHAATDGPDTDWTAKLVDVDETGRAINLCDGILRARFRDSLEHPIPVEPGRVYEYRIRVGSTSNLFLRGHRIRLEVASSNFPTFDVNLNTGQRVGRATVLDGRVATQAVFHDGARPSRLLLPVVPR
jgi:putative CocE/NonD family hydrolase